MLDREDLREALTTAAVVAALAALCLGLAFAMKYQYSAYAVVALMMVGGPTGLRWLQHSDPPAAVTRGVRTFVLVGLAVPIVLFTTPWSGTVQIAIIGAIAVLLVVTPILGRRITDGKVATGRCHNCGHDLSTSRDAIQCPECGAVIDRFAAFGSHGPVEETRQ